MQIHEPDIYGDIELAGNPGINGQVLSSQGPGVQAAWLSAPLPLQWAYTDKPVQVIVLGPADLTWNVPGANAISGVTFVPNQFTLPGGPRTYMLEAVIVPSAAPAAPFLVEWVDLSNTTFGDLNVPGSGPAGSLGHVHAFCVVRTIGALACKVRLVSAVGLAVSADSTVHIRTVD